MAQAYTCPFLIMLDVLCNNGREVEGTFAVKVYNNRCVQYAFNGDVIASISGALSNRVVMCFVVWSVLEAVELIG